MDSKMIEKAFEKFMDKELGFIPNPQDGFYHLHKKLWLECANWQREQLEAEIKELRSKAIPSQFFTDEIQKREKIISELESMLREAGDIIKIVKENVIHYTVGKEEQELDYKMSQFLAKLDLLEKGGVE